MAMAKPSMDALAVVVGKPKGGDVPPDGDSEMAGVGPEEMEEASVIFDAEASPDERAAALKEFIRLCTKGGY